MEIKIKRKNRKRGRICAKSFDKRFVFFGQTITYKSLETSLDNFSPAGFMSGTYGQNLNKGLDKTFKKVAPTISSELQSLATGAATAAATNTHFDAAQILINNLGNAIGNNIVNELSTLGTEKVAESAVEAAKKEMEKEKPQTLAELLKFSADTRAEQSRGAWKDDAFDDLTYTSDLFQPWEEDSNKPSFDNRTFWKGRQKDTSFLNSPLASSGLLEDGYGDLYGSKTLGMINNIAMSSGEGALAIRNTDIITGDQLKIMFPNAKPELLESYLPELNTQLAAAEINTPKRLAYFFATVNEETGGMTKFVENDFIYKNPARAKLKFSTNLGKMSLKEIKALGSGKLFANTIYANINGNGNASTGDGYKYRGRGLFHHTGRGNYKKLGGDVYANNPDLILIPSNSVRAAVTYWNRGGLDKLVDKLSPNIKVDSGGNVADLRFKEAVRAINGGTTNINNRAVSYNRYIELFYP